MKTRMKWNVLCVCSGLALCLVGCQPAVHRTPTTVKKASEAMQPAAAPNAPQQAAPAGSK